MVSDYYPHSRLTPFSDYITWALNTRRHSSGNARMGGIPAWYNTGDGLDPDSAIKQLYLPFPWPGWPHVRFALTGPG
jgi:hypothetical protein